VNLLAIPWLCCSHAHQMKDEHWTRPSHRGNQVGRGVSARSNSIVASQGRSSVLPVWQCQWHVHYKGIDFLSSVRIYTWLTTTQSAAGPSEGTERQPARATNLSTQCKSADHSIQQAWIGTGFLNCRRPAQHLWHQGQQASPDRTTPVAWHQPLSELSAASRRCEAGTDSPERRPPKCSVLRQASRGRTYLICRHVSIVLTWPVRPVLSSKADKSNSSQQVRPSSEESGRRL
jgi:hypothetical protein